MFKIKKNNATLLKDDTYKCIKIVQKAKRKINKILSGGFLSQRFCD